MRAREVALVGMLLLHANVARADESPWSKGVAPELRERAQKLLKEGNDLLLDRKFAEALDRYRGAITSWDHPAIRFNIVRCLIQLDRPVEAFDELDKALAYGAGPLEDEVYNEALAYQKLLAKQIATVKVRCEQPGVQLTLDGQPLAPCPAEQLRRVVPGRHQLVGDKVGYVPRTIAIIVVGGTTETVALELDPLASRAKIVHRFATWVPWSVVGGGLAVAGVGGLVQLAAANDADSYERELARSCSAGCQGETLANLRSLESRARLENRIAIGIVAVGAATVIAGGVLLVLNRGTTQYEAAPVDVLPTAGGGVVMLRGRF